MRVKKKERKKVTCLFTDFNCNLTQLLKRPRFLGNNEFNFPKVIFLISLFNHGGFLLPPGATHTKKDGADRPP